MLGADSDPIKPTRIYGELRKVLDRDAVVVCDGGDFVSYAGKYIDSYEPGCWLDPGPYGCLGTGMGYAIAARVARPDRQVVVMMGDGAAGFSLLDVDSLVRHGLPVVIVVGNNGCWALEKFPMTKLYGYHVAAELRPGTRYDQVVEALGGAGEMVTEAGQLAPALAPRVRVRGAVSAERHHRPRRRVSAAISARLTQLRSRALQGGTVSGRPILDGLRIVDLTSGIAGPYCTKLFVDAGAEVIKVEAPAGDRMRKWSASGATFADGESGPMFAYLNTSKSSVIADLTTVEGREFVLELAAKAELVVEDFEPGMIESLGLALSDLHAVNKRVSLISLSHFGRGGPWSNRTANEFTLQAQVGSTDYRGIPGHGTCGRCGPARRIRAGLVRRARRAGRGATSPRMGVGVHVDLSQHESMMLSFQVFRQVTAVYDPGRWLGRSFEVPSVEPAKDGWVGFCTITAQQFTDFCHLIGAPELAVPELMFAEARAWPTASAYGRRSGSSRKSEQSTRSWNSRVPCVSP